MLLISIIHTIAYNRESHHNTHASAASHQQLPMMHIHDHCHIVPFERERRRRCLRSRRIGERQRGYSHKIPPHCLRIVRNIVNALHTNVRILHRNHYALVTRQMDSFSANGGMYSTYTYVCGNHTACNLSYFMRVTFAFARIKHNRQSGLASVPHSAHIRNPQCASSAAAAQYRHTSVRRQRIQSCTQLRLCAFCHPSASQPSIHTCECSPQAHWKRERTKKWKVQTSGNYHIFRNYSHGEWHVWVRDCDAAWRSHQV